MDHRHVGRLWNENAEVWTRLSRAGYDTYRDAFNTPAFLAMLPAVAGLRGLDVGCGEGTNTRLLAQRGAQMTAIDIAEAFVRHASDRETAGSSPIDYGVASAVALPFAEGAFDFATGFMSFMDIPETAWVLAEAYRVLRPGGFLQFSITHPCFDTSHRRNLRWMWRPTTNIKRINEWQGGGKHI
jgi:ubiquinone/menaquinone biosynthesis C-methylase UbiE